VFDALKKGFKEAQNRLAGLTELDQRSIQPALREVRTALLEADVELGVVKRFLAHVEEKAVGRTVQIAVKHAGEKLRASAGDQFIKICHDELVALMTSEGAALSLPEKGARGSIMMVGLQGSGKTTTCAKLAALLVRKGHRPLLVAADMQRPAAVEQLRVLGAKIDVPVWNVAGATPLEICRSAAEEAKRLGRDVVIYDTAGRLAIDEPLMEELAAIKAAVSPENVLLVLDAMIGQDAVRTASAFNERLGLTGAVLTKLDGDARGGAALSVKDVTGAPVLFVGVGEGVDKLEEFRAEGMAGRVLGMGDIVGLMKEFEDVIDQKKAEEDALRMMSGQFTLDDFVNQVRTIRKMGSLKDLVERIPGLGGMMPPGASLDERELVKIEAMVQSMTPAERRDPNALIREPSRVERIARGSGCPAAAVTELVQKFVFMQQMMTGMGGPDLGMLSRIPGMQGLNLARNLRRAMKGGKLPPGMPGMGMPGMPGMGMPGMGMPGIGMPGMPGMGMPGAGAPAPRMARLSQAEKNAKKNQRKRERDSRKKNRGK